MILKLSLHSERGEWERCIARAIRGCTGWLRLKSCRGWSLPIPDRLLRFEQEARAAAALNHPNILAVYQMGTYQGVPYMVSELLEGETLHEMLRRGGPLPLRKAIDYGVQTAHGLVAAHEKGIVHRDLKPENLFITKFGRVKILDFGLAKLRERKEAPPGPLPTQTLQTEAGMVQGTLGYMSPEQVRGQALDHRADIFAFGAILYEMVMGKRTFQKATSADTISAILNEEPPPISQFAPDTPAGLQKVVHRCLEKKREQRFQSAADLAFALEVLADPATTTHSAFREAVPRARQIRPAYAAAVTALVILVVALGYYWTRPPVIPSVSNYVQLTHDGQPKSLVGTDGSRLYLALGSSGSSASQGIAAMSVSGGEPQKLAGVPSPDMVPVSLSPDGSQLLVVDGQGAPPRGPMWSLPVLGGSPRKLGDAVAETGAWSPDGAMLAYSNTGDLFVAKADGTAPRKLASVSGHITGVTWSPDSGHLRFDSESLSGIGQQAAWEVSADGKDLRHVFSEGQQPAAECCGKWTSGGEYYVFQANGQIWELPSKGRFLRSAPTPIQLTSSPLSLSSPLPSKDGKKLFVIGQTYRGQLMRYDAKAAQFAPFLSGISAEYVAFSKDAQWVAYVSYPQGTLWRSKLDGSERLQLTYPPLYPVLPRWSPDGKEIVFFEFGLSADKPARMYEVSAAGESPRQLLPDDRHNQEDPNWSPDGTKIAFGGQSNDSASNLRVLDLASGQVSSLPDSQGMFSPRWSPNGKNLVALSADSKRVLMFDFQTQKWTEIASGSLGWLNWSSDGQYVYFLDYTGTGAVLRVRVADHKSEKVADLKNFITTGRYGGWLALAPDDSPLLLRDAGTQDVYSLDWQAH